MSKLLQYRCALWSGSEISLHGSWLCICSCCSQTALDYQYCNVATVRFSISVVPPSTPVFSQYPSVSLYYERLNPLNLCIPLPEMLSSTVSIHTFSSYTSLHSVRPLPPLHLLPFLHILPFSYPFVLREAFPSPRKRAGRVKEGRRFFRSRFCDYSRRNNWLITRQRRRNTLIIKPLIKHILKRTI